MRVGLFGYYEHGELCGDLVERAIKGVFNELAEIEWLNLWKDNVDFKSLDLVVLGGG
jgi:hypothetical protein